jgi:hypothetical protein
MQTGGDKKTKKRILSSLDRADQQLRLALSRLVQAEKEKGAGADPAGGSGSGVAAQKKSSSSGNLRLKKAAENGGASARQLRSATKAHNERYCIKVGETRDQSGVAQPHGSGCQAHHQWWWKVEEAS